MNNCRNCADGLKQGKKLEMADRDSIMNKIKPAIRPFEVIEEANANN